MIYKHHFRFFLAALLLSSSFFLKATDPKNKHDTPLIYAVPRFDFNSFNPFLENSWPLVGAHRLHASLTLYDEKTKTYKPYVAQSFTEDQKSLTFNLNPNALFSDKSQILAQRCCDSFNLLKEEGCSFYKIHFKTVTCEAKNPRSVTFKSVSTLSLPQKFMLKTMPVFGKNLVIKNLKQQPTTSGPYVIKQYNPVKGAVFKKNELWWGAMLPHLTNKQNFSEIDVRYIPNSEVMHLALKNQQLNFHYELNPQLFARYTDTPFYTKDLPFSDTENIKVLFFNCKSPLLRNKRIRQALVKSFITHFHQVNRSLFKNAYTLSSGIGTLYQSEEFLNSKIGLKEALIEAGWQLKGRTYLNKEKEKARLKIVTLIPAHKKVMKPWIDFLQKNGIQAKIVLSPSPLAHQKAASNKNYDGYIPHFTHSMPWSYAAATFWSSQDYSLYNNVKDDCLANHIKALNDQPAPHENKEIFTALCKLFQDQAYIIPLWKLKRFRITSLSPLSIPLGPQKLHNFDGWSWL